jgi:hypothetical protein
MALALSGLVACQVEPARPGPVDVKPAASAEAGDVPDIEHRDFSYPLSLEDALAILSQTSVFADEAVGFAGHPTRQVQAYNTLLDRPDAGELALKVFRCGRSAGQLYALCALQLLDHPEAQACADTLRGVDEDVEVFSGCLHSRRPVSEVVDEVTTTHHGQRLRAARQVTDEHFARAR